MSEVPAISGSTYSAACLSVDSAALFADKSMLADNDGIANMVVRAAGGPFKFERQGELQRIVRPPDPLPVTPKAPMPTAIRIVKVFIADNNDNLPLEKRLLFSGSEQLTDLTDQELFFEVPIIVLLKAHNELRLATLDKAATAKAGRDVFLEAVRIRDLKMVVVTVASF